MNWENHQRKVTNLLSEGRESVERRLSGIFDRAAGDAKDRIVLCGAGPLGRRTLRGLRSAGIEPIGFIDNNSKLWNTELDGLRVFPPQEMVAVHHESAVFVVTIFNNSAVRRQLHALGCSRVVPFTSLYWKFARGFLPFCCLGDTGVIFQEAEAVVAGLDLWSDQCSRDYYISQLEWRLSLDPAVLPSPCPAKDTYFLDDRATVRRDEVVVDCGAFDGDFIRALLERRRGKFQTIVALEPDPRSYESLERYAGSLGADIRDRMVLRQLAAASTNGHVFFDARGDVCSSVSEEGATRIPCGRLDEILADHPPTYIKMDIEGGEIDALEGARKVIAMHRPVLAICAYHKQNDLWQIPRKIRSLYAGYRLFLRLYAEDCWEIVCYAIPEERLVS